MKKFKEKLLQNLLFTPKKNFFMRQGSSKMKLLKNTILSLEVLQVARNKVLTTKNETLRVRKAWIVIDYSHYLSTDNC